MQTPTFISPGTRRRRSSALFAGACLLAAGTAWAGPDDAAVTPQAPPAAESLGDPVSDAKLRQFALAAANVQAVQQEYVVEAEVLKSETEARIVDSVEQAGMTVDEFRAIFQQVQADPTLAQRLDELTAP